MLRSRIAAVALASTLGAGLAGVALAASDAKEASEQQEIAAVTSAKTSLSQAIAAAEQQTGGKAVSAAFEDRDGTKGYEVAIASGSKLQKVLVDPETGNVIKTLANDAKADEDSDNDKD